MDRWMNGWMVERRREGEGGTEEGADGGTMGEELGGGGEVSMDRWMDGREIGGRESRGRD